MSEELVKEIFKNNVIREREERGWSHHTLAKKSGLNLSTIKAIETHGSMTARSLAAICKGFDLDPWVLLIEEGK